MLSIVKIDLPTGKRLTVRKLLDNLLDIDSFMQIKYHGLYKSAFFNAGGCFVCIPFINSKLAPRNGMMMSC